MRFWLILPTLMALLGACTTTDTSNPPWHSDMARSDCCLDIAHAAGKLGDVPYTNSIEALMANYAKGRRVFEVDIALTSDGHLVLAHDWDAFGGVAPDLAAFRAQDMGHTPTDFEAFLAWAQTHCDDCLFVTDAKDPFRTFWPAFTGAVPAPKRETLFIVQTYSVEQSLELAKTAPRQRQILTLYLQTDLTDADLAALRDHPSLIAITMPMNRVPAWSRRVIRTLGLPVYSHAYPWVMENGAFLSIARAYGAGGFYMD